MKSLRATAFELDFRNFKGIVHKCINAGHESFKQK